MNEPHDPNRTVDAPTGEATSEERDLGGSIDRSWVRADLLEAGLAAAFGPLRSTMGDMRPVLLKEAEGECAHVVNPTSDAMPPTEQIGDRYELFGEIARGGMGAVLRGRDMNLGRSTEWDRPIDRSFPRK
jgi:hypothetical protein